MNRRDRYEMNQRLARIEARLARIEARLAEMDPTPPGPPREVSIDMFTSDLQAEFIREGRVYRGKVY